MSHKKLFSRFIEADPERLHFAAHSHQYWPDVSFEGHQQAWLDAATFADLKWDRFFGQVWPRAQGHVARILNLPDPKTIAFGPSIHAFLVRLMSSLPPGRAHRVLTTDGEFHSLSRQLARLEEDGLVEVVRVPTRPFSTFESRWKEAAAAGGFDLAYVSQVFFDSGYSLPELGAIVSAIKDDETLVAIDGYHGFCALPTDLSRVAHRAFYMSGGYKYAMSGEGCCFIHAPDGYVERPRDTGWFAAFGVLKEAQSGKVPYAEGGARMMGATFDPTPVYRFNAVMDMLVRESIDVGAIHAHVTKLEELFVHELAKHAGHPLREEALVVPVTEPNRGNFLTYSLPEARRCYERLLARNVLTDVRGDRLRFGFAIYHDEIDMVRGAERIAAALRE
jgi:kynureninase